MPVRLLHAARARARSFGARCKFSHVASGVVRDPSKVRFASACADRLHSAVCLSVRCAPSGIDGACWQYTRYSIDCAADSEATNRQAMLDTLALARVSAAEVCRATGAAAAVLLSLL
jgi:hypothetical protein